MGIPCSYSRWNAGKSGAKLSALLSNDRNACMEGEVFTVALPYASISPDKK